MRAGKGLLFGIWALRRKQGMAGFLPLAMRLFNDLVFAYHVV